MNHAELIDEIERLMRRARLLGMYRTGKKLHQTLRVARNERFEAEPRIPVAVFTVGPIKEQ